MSFPSLLGVVVFLLQVPCSGSMPKVCPRGTRLERAIGAGDGWWEEAKCGAGRSCQVRRTVVVVMMLRCWRWRYRAGLGHVWILSSIRVRLLIVMKRE